MTTVVIHAPSPPLHREGQPLTPRFDSSPAKPLRPRQKAEPVIPNRHIFEGEVQEIQRELVDRWKTMSRRSSLADSSDDEIVEAKPRKPRAKSQPRSASEPVTTLHARSASRGRERPPSGRGEAKVPKQEYDALQQTVKVQQGKIEQLQSLVSKLMASAPTEKKSILRPSSKENFRDGNDDGNSSSSGDEKPNTSVSHPQLSPPVSQRARVGFTPRSRAGAAEKRKSVVEEVPKTKVALALEKAKRRSSQSTQEAPPPTRLAAHELLVEASTHLKETFAEERKSPRRPRSPSPPSHVVHIINSARGEPYVLSDPHKEIGDQVIIPKLKFQPRYSPPLRAARTQDKVVSKPLVTPSSHPAARAALTSVYTEPVPRRSPRKIRPLSGHPPPQQQGTASQPLSARQGTHARTGTLQRIEYEQHQQTEEKHMSAPVSSRRTLNTMVLATAVTAGRNSSPTKQSPRKTPRGGGEGSETERPSTRSSARERLGDLLSSLRGHVAKVTPPQPARHVIQPPVSRPVRKSVPPAPTNSAVSKISAKLSHPQTQQHKPQQPSSAVPVVQAPISDSLKPVPTTTTTATARQVSATSSRVSAVSISSIASRASKASSNTSKPSTASKATKQSVASNQTAHSRISIPALTVANEFHELNPADSTCDQWMEVQLLSHHIQHVNSIPYMSPTPVERKQVPPQLSSGPQTNSTRNSLSDLEMASFDLPLPSPAAPRRIITDAELAVRKRSASMLVDKRPGLGLLHPVPTRPRAPTF